MLGMSTRSSPAEPCAIVDYAGPGAWGELRRAFCGNRFPFRDSDELQTFAAMAPGVPFGWLHDERGFIVPEVRLSDAKGRRLSFGQQASGAPDPGPALMAPGSNDAAGTGLQWTNWCGWMRQRTTPLARASSSSTRLAYPPPVGNRTLT